MSQDRADPSDRPFMPPQTKAGPGLARLVVILVALAALIAGAYRAYLWLVDDVSHRRAMAEHAIEASSSADSAGPPPPPGPVATGEPPAPAVAGGSVNRCAAGGQVIFTNTPCPEGSRPIAADAIVEPSPVATRPAALSGGADASQQQADCNFLAAEITRLNYEFSQPLPPPVLDHISTRLAGLRAQADAARCAPLKAASSAASAPQRRRAPPTVVDEKAGA
ncbi:MAG: hypothetical protein FWG56_05895 [Desulfovibrionaceae bacterium]|nr:hypothetical protein [Desulfovibrionaceae bacterium]